MKLFKLKRKNIILVSLLAIAGFLGISSVAVNTATSKETPVAEKADATSSGTIIYLDPSHSGASWTGSHLCAWVWYSSGSKWEEFSYDGLSQKYLIKLNDSATGLTMARTQNSPGNNKDQWKDCGTIYNKADFDISETNNYIMSNGYGSGDPSPLVGTVGTLNYYLLGSFNNWTKNDSYKLTDTLDDDGHQASISKSIAEKSKFKFIINYNGSSTYFGFDDLNQSQNPLSARTAGLLTWKDGGNIYSERTTAYSFYLKTDRTIWNEAPADSYFYYIGRGNAATTDVLYTWNSDDTVRQFGDWPGTAIASIRGVQEVSGVIHFNGEDRKIYKIPVESYVTSNLIISGGGKQSSDVNYSQGCISWDGNSDSSPIISGDQFTALELIFDLESKRNAVSGGGSIKQYSICGISQSDANTLYTSYNKLSPARKAIVDNSTIYTWKGTSSTQTDVPLSAVFYQLGINGGNISRSASFMFSNIFGNDNNNFSTIVIVVASSVSLLSVTALSILVIRKRKSKED